MQLKILTNKYNIDYTKNDFATNEINHSKYYKFQHANGVSHQITYYQRLFHLGSENIYIYLLILHIRLDVLQTHRTY